MHLLYLTFGENISNHIQAQFSILSFLNKNEQIKTINIITDRSDFYNNLKGRVNVITISDKTLKEWKGEYDFFWRIKIKAIEMLCDLYKGMPVLYMDSDTFLYGNFSNLYNGALSGIAFMHENEGRLSAEKSKTGKNMWQQVKDRSYGNIVISMQHCMWNAGVVLLPNIKNNQECLLALEICDKMCEQGITRRLIEQFALSVALQEVYGLRDAQKEIAHFWSNKTAWNNIIEQFFIISYFNGNTTEQNIEAIKAFDFCQVPVKIRSKNTNTRLKTLIDKLYPDRDIFYITDKN